MLLIALCACSNNKSTNGTGQPAGDSVQAAAVQDSIKADSVAKAEAAAAEASRLDPESMKAVVRKLFNTSGTDNVLALMSGSWRAKYEKRCRKFDWDLLSSGGDQSVLEGSLKITSANPENGMVKASATLESPDEESEDGIYRETASYTFRIVKEDGKHLIDYCEFKTDTGGLKDGGLGE